jgi:hypothetical protein
MGVDHELLAGDINGDGRTDLVLLSRTGGGGALVFALRSTGRKFVSQEWGVVSYNWTNAAIGDFDGDGRSDVYIPYEAPVLLLSQASTFKPVTSGIPEWAHYSGDFNGDGRADLMFVGRSKNFAWHSLDGTQDLMSSVQNVWGGTTQIEYQPSSRHKISASASDRLPFIMQTVSKVTQNDGRGNASATGFTYSDGKWHPGERRFLGFKSVIMSLPCTPGERPCPMVNYTFRQDLASAGKVVKKEVKVGTKVLRSVEETWDTELKKVPYTALNTKTSTTEHLDGGDRRRSVERTFDRYGNVTELTDHGRDGVGGEGLSEFPCKGRVHHPSLKRPSKRMANWAFAMPHSRGGIFHSFCACLKTRNNSLIALSSVGKWPRARTARRSLAFRASMALVV